MIPLVALPVQSLYIQQPPVPSARTYRVLGLLPGAAVAECVAAFDRLSAHYDPRRWPADPKHQHWAIAHTDDLDEVLALILDAERWGEVAA